MRDVVIVAGLNIELNKMRKISKNSRRVLLTFVLDPELVDVFLEKLTRLGFFGKRTSNRIRKELLQEYRRQGEQMLDKIYDKLKKDGVDCEKEFHMEKFEKIMRNILEREYIKNVFMISESDQSPFFSYFKKKLNWIAKNFNVKVRVL